MLRLRTYGKKRRVSPTPVSSWATNLSTAAPQTIGLSSSLLPKAVITPRFRPTSSSVPITPSKLSPKTILPQSPCSELCTSFGELQARGSPVARGMKQRGVRIPRTRVQNSGMDTKAKKTLLSMNSEERSEFLTCSAGAIDTPSTLKPNMVRRLFERLPFGLPQTSTLDSGIPLKILRP